MNAHKCTNISLKCSLMCFGSLSLSLFFSLSLSLSLSSAYRHLQRNHIKLLLVSIVSLEPAVR